ncbi:MAG: phytoene desaturase family protein [Desulfomonilaceae bacterium]
MWGRPKYDAVIVGSGPNGLAAAITIAREKRSVLLLEAKDTIGGGTRTKELTLPGFKHDVCSAVHPLALASPFLRSIDLAQYGLEWIHSPVTLAHPLDNDKAILLDRSLERTAEGLGSDANAYRKIINPCVGNWKSLVEDLLKPLGFPSRPLALMKFGFLGMRSAVGLVHRKFKGKRAAALFAGNAAHSILSFDHWSSAAFGLMLPTLGHAVGWPIVRGGSQYITNAMACHLESLGGEIKTSVNISSIDDVCDSKAILFDVTPKQLAKIAGHKFSKAYQNKLVKHYHGPGVFKIDWALKMPVPWLDPACLGAITLHVGGTFEEIASAEKDVYRGRAPQKPFIFFAQPSLFDQTRAPNGTHTAWGYCHVPNGCPIDMTDRIESQIERFAPGFRDLIITKHVMFPSDMEAYNPNYIGGDIVGGSQAFLDLFFRPLGRWRAYSTPAKGIYICSSSMPPGGGVHGMCGHLAAKRALRDVL